MVNLVTDSMRSKTVRRWLSMLLPVCFTACLLSVIFVATANAQQPHPGTEYPKTVDPWGIIIYEHPDYTGGWITYAMEPWTRQKLVQQIAQGWEDKVTSIQVGSNVGVYLFAGRDFYAGSTSDRRRYDQSISKVEVDFRVGSLIVFPKTAKGPIGVWLRDLRASIMATGDPLGNSREITFFPLPESEAVVKQEWGSLGQFNLDKNANYVEFDPKYVEMTLYEGRDLQGEWLTLPGAGAAPSYFGANLGRYSWSDRAASLVVRWKGPPGSLGPKGLSWPPVINPVANAPRSFTFEQGLDLPGKDYKSFFVDGGSEVCEKACAADPNCKAFTWVKPGVQGAKAACWLKTAVPAAENDPNCVSGWSGTQPPRPALPPGQGTWSFTPDLSGEWHSSAGVVYTISQRGEQISWEVKNGNESGIGMLTGTQISARWSGDKGRGSATGQVIVDASGKPIRIEWSNGVSFFRQQGAMKARERRSRP